MQVGCYTENMSEDETIYLNNEYDVRITDDGIAITDGESNVVTLNLTDATRLMAIVGSAILARD